MLAAVFRVRPLRRPVLLRALPMWSSDAAALAAFALALVALERDVFANGAPVGMDAATAFYPWYSFLGERLRAGAIPLWNPHQFSGTPFAANPESGWMYLPAMVLFTILPLAPAASAFVLAQVLLAGVWAYALARTLGIAPEGALLAAIAYAASGFLFGHSMCCFAYAGVATWLPLLLLGAERAVRSWGWQARGLWWGVAGVALSQILAVWVGQGAYYVALVLACYVACRTLLPLPRTRAALLSQAATCCMHLGGIALFGAALAAAGLLPRIEFNLQSNLPLGYPPGAAPPPLDAASMGRLLTSLVSPSFYYAGVSVAILALAALASAPRRRTVLVFGGLTLLTLALAVNIPTPFSLLPGFDRLTGRSPERALIVFYLGPALLAGYAIHLIRQASWWSLHWRRLACAVLTLVVFADLRNASRVEFADAMSGDAAYDLRNLDLADYYQPTEAARFLQTAATEEPFRYFGYAGHVFGGPFPYTNRWTDPHTVALEVNNRALVTGLQDIQGYDPIHVARYDHYISAMNGTEQNYHHSDVFESGLDSPLLDLLNVRYVVLPAHLASDQKAPRFTRSLRPIFQDDTVTVFENAAALPRAWLVHRAQQASSADALQLLASGAIDPRETALVESAPPSLAPASFDVAQVTRYDPEHRTVRAATDAPALLVLSEVYDPAWYATVDGAAQSVAPVDGALMAIAIPPGEHEVALHYEPLSMKIGLAVTLAATAGLLLLVLARVCQRPRRLTRL